MASAEDPMTEEAIKRMPVPNIKEGNIGHNYDDRYNVHAVFKGETKTAGA